MSIAFVKNIGTQGSSSTTAGVFTQQVPAGGVPVGALLILRFASYNYKAGSVAPTVSDSRGNTWQQDYSRVSASDGMNIVASTVVTTALLAGDTIQVAFTAGNQNYAMAVDQFSGPATSGWRFQVDATGTTSTTTAPTDTITLNAGAPPYVLVVGALFVPAPSTDGYTEDTVHTGGGDSWHSLTASYSPSGTTTQATYGAYKILAPDQVPTVTTLTWSPTLGVAHTSIETMIVYRGQTTAVTITDKPAGTRTGAPVSSLVVDVPIATDTPVGVRSGDPRSTVVGAPPQPLTLTSDTPAGVRSGAPVDAVAVDVPITSDTPAGARSGAPVDAVAVGVTVASDTPVGSRSGATVDGPLLIGVTCLDTPIGSRSGAPVGTAAIGVTLATDVPVGVRSGAPVALIGNTVTSDSPAGVRSGAPVDVLAGNGAFPMQPSSLTGEMPNPTRPLLQVYADFTAGPPNTVGGYPVRRSLNSRNRRTIARKIDIQRGRQYELDQVQAGTATLEVVDPLENLNPSNPASPLNQNGQALKSYRAIRIAALWPNTGNLINPLINPGNDPSFESDPSFGRWAAAGAGTTLAFSTTVTPTDNFLSNPGFESGTAPWVVSSNGVLTQSTTQVHSGTYAGKVVPSGTGFQTYVATEQVPVTAGVSYTASVWVWLTAAVSGNFTCSIDWFDANHTYLSTSAKGVSVAAGTWTQVMNTYTAPVGAAYGAVSNALTGNPPATNIFYVDDALLSRALAWDGARSVLVKQTTSGAGFGASNMFLGAADIDTVFSVFVRPASGTQVQVKVTDGSGVAHFSNVASIPNVWTRIIVSWRAADICEAIEVFGTGTAPSFYMDATQLEFALNPSEFVTTGPDIYLVYSGYIERYPLRYDMNGGRGIRPLTAVDALAILSRTQVNESYSATIAADNPHVVIPLRDSTGPHQVQRPRGGPPMGGYTQLGANSGAVNYGGDTFLDGSPAVSLVQQNTAPDPTYGDANQTTWVGTRGGAMTMSPQSFTLEMWVRWASGVTYFGAAAMQAKESTVGEYTGPQKYVGFYTTGGALTSVFIDPNGGTSPYYVVPHTGTGFNGFPDGQWHLFAMRFVGGNQFNIVIDDTTTPNVAIGFTPSTSVGLNNFFAEAVTTFGDPVTQISVANIAAYPYALSGAQFFSHYQRGIGYVGELSGNRVNRLLSKYWGGPMLTAPGVMPMAADFGYNTRMLLDVIQEIQESERGLLYANANGTVVFDDRLSRYRSQAVVKAVFGEDAASGEIPYEDYQAEVDPTYTFSQANLTRPDNSDFPPVVNQQAQADYGQRILSHNVQCTSDFELTQAAIFYLQRYGQTVLRVEKLTLNPITNPSSWAPLLALEIGDRITIKRRAGAVLLNHDYYVEQISHSIDGDAGTWKIDLQASPVFVPQAWVLGDATYGVLGSTTYPVY